MKKSLAMGAILAAMIFSASAMRAQDDPASSDPANSDPALVAAAAAPVQTIAPEEVLKLMDAKDASIQLVDTQPADGFTEGHIPGAVNYPWVMRIKTFPIALPRNKTLIFYGSCPNDTADIVKQLAEYGYLNVKIMDGGWYKWLELKYPAAGTNPVAPSPAPELSQLSSAPAKDAKAAPTTGKP